MGLFEKFLSDVKKGYDKQDAVMRSEKEKSSDGKRIIESAAIGLAEGLLNPVRWISGMLK